MKEPNLEGTDWSEIHVDRMNLSVIHHHPDFPAQKAAEEQQELAARLSRILEEAEKSNV